MSGMHVGQPHDHAGHDPDCAVAHGEVPTPAPADRVLVAVFANPVAAHLLRLGRQLGFRTTLVEPDAGRIDPATRAAADAIVHDPHDAAVDASTDVVVTDHHRDGLGGMMAPLVRRGPRWIGIMGSARHVGPHIAALRAEGVPEYDIERVHRPIGLDIGSRTPPEIAISTMAGLLADRAGRRGGFLASRQPVG